MEEIEDPEDNLPFTGDDGHTYYEDEHGELWRLVKNLPCPKELKLSPKDSRAIPVKILNLSYTVNIETALVSLPYPHSI